MKDTKPKPFLRWAGSKRQLLPILSEFWKDTHRRYIEPFAGSACLFFYLCPEKAILGDVNSELIEAYQQVQDNYEAVHSSLRSYKGGKEEYYQVRQTNPDDLDPVLRASRFIYLNRYCFNGLYRTNRKGFFNVPYGGTRTGRLPNLEELASVSCLLRKADLLNCDFESVIDRAKQGDFVYMDPPYKVESRRVFNEYDASVFVEADLERLKKQLESLSERGVDFLVSYAESEEANYLKKGFNCRQVTVRRNIAGFTSSRKSATEILITNCCILG